MASTDELTRRNAEFAASDFLAGLSINPSGAMMVVACVDPRVDPARVLGLRQGEAAVIRNVGGRITPATLKTMKTVSLYTSPSPRDRSLSRMPSSA
jgi:carbonic anhydrase